MAEFVSEVKTIPHADVDVYRVLSDLNNLESLRERVPEDKIKEFSFDKDSCTLTVDPVGKVRLVIVEREPNKTIKVEAEQMPFGLTMWVQLMPSAENETKLKLTVKADLNPFLKPMVSKPLQQGLDKMAETLSTLAYDEIINNGTAE